MGWHRASNRLIARLVCCVIGLGSNLFGCDDRIQAAAPVCSPTLCDDSIDCTADNCGADGCEHVAQHQKCADGLPCTDDRCGVAGCLHVPSHDTCDDDNPCTTADRCLAGACSGVSKACDDANACTSDKCYGGSCVHTDVQSGIPCKNKDVCTVDSRCTLGHCVAAGPALWITALGPTVANLSVSAVRALPDGGAVVGGGEGTGWLMRVSASGAVTWRVEYAEVAIRDVAVVGDGFVLVGWKRETKSTRAIWFARADSVGRLVWQRSLQNSPDDTAVRVFSTPQGPAILAQTRQGAAKGLNGWLAHIDITTGEILDQQTFGADGDDMPTDFAPTSDGGILVVGQTNSFGHGDSDGWVVRFGATHEIMWQNAIGGSGPDGIERVGLASGGSIHVIGRSKSTHQNLATYAQLGAEGDVIMEQNLGSSVNLSDLLVRSDGALWLAGSQEGAPWLAQRATAGAIGWSKVFATAVAHSPRLAVANSAGVFVAAQIVDVGGWRLWLGRFDAWGQNSCAVSGNCVHKGPSDCTDGDPCTVDRCGALGCEHSDLDCGDGEPCTTDGCSDQSCHHDPIACDDNDVCTKDTCDAAGACFHTPTSGSSCRDVALCGAKTCAVGVCAPSAGPACDDGNPCTADACKADKCQYIPLVDGSVCDDGQVCSTAQDCRTGHCTPSAEITWRREFEQWAVTDVVNVVADATGGAWLALQQLSANGLHGARIARIGTDGKLAWSAPAPTGDDKVMTSFVVLDDENALAAGSTAPAVDAPAQVWLSHWTASGATKPVPVPNTTSCQRIVALGAMADANFAWLAQCTAASPTKESRAVVGVQAVSGSTLWQQTIDIAGGCAPIALATCASAVAVAVAPTKGAESPQLCKYSTLGQLLWQIPVMQSIAQMQWTADGQIVAVSKNGLWLRWSASGQALSPVQLALTGQPSRLAALPNGEFALTENGNPAMAGAWLTRVSLAGKGTQHAQLDLINTLGADALAVVGDGFYVAGHTALHRAWLERVDAWGNGNCKSSGGCAGLMYADCVDGDPCTIDACTAATGCQYKPISACLP